MDSSKTLGDGIGIDQTSSLRPGRSGFGNTDQRMSQRTDPRIISYPNISHNRVNYLICGPPVSRSNKERRKNSLLGCSTKIPTAALEMCNAFIAAHYIIILSRIYYFLYFIPPKIDIPVVRYFVRKGALTVIALILPDPPVGVESALSRGRLTK